MRVWNKFSFLQQHNYFLNFAVGYCGRGQFVEMASLSYLRYEDRVDRVSNFSPWKEKITMILKMNGL